MRISVDLFDRAFPRSPEKIRRRWKPDRNSFDKSPYEKGASRMLAPFFLSFYGIFISPTWVNLIVIVFLVTRNDLFHNFPGYPTQSTDCLEPVRRVRSILSERDTIILPSEGTPPRQGERHTAPHAVRFRFFPPPGKVWKKRLLWARVRFRSIHSFHIRAAPPIPRNRIAAPTATILWRRFYAERLR